ncbi:MAG: tryptophan--tRNA ligase [Bacteroidota bacterium]|jgi:tryptophanyl-tRNA synthetase|nr:tryptophan--tRNA ligase [Bacteroidales bacterium]MDI9535065.1 tryptophan--tRNA ligase [Bacteroidota bacterium]NLP19373.1 tryptophan--tRNA ligase [Bacteroidales bacterium]HOD87414.1 tryptophan--tRNA ligase [Bacteroidales bacterium]
METVLSGIRSTGNLHLGNYLGAVQNFVKMQNDYNCYFFIADYHSLTTHPTPENLHNSVRQVLVEYLAAGIDPEKSTLYIQSDVPEITELYLLLNMNAYMGELARTTTFKEKARQQPENVNAGLLTYPVLMAADIIIHNADKVPVGKDQEQNLEMARRFARRFNNMYSVEYFKEPQAFNFGKELIKIPGLDGSGKMGKSEGNGIYLADEASVIRKKVMRALTDSGPTEKNSEMPESIQNLFTIMKVVSTPDTVKFFEEQYANCEIRYGDLKKQIAEDVIKMLAPINQKIKEIDSNTEYLSKVAKMGAEKARENASKTLKDVKEIIGFRRFW